MNYTENEEKRQKAIRNFDHNKSIIETNLSILLKNSEPLKVNTKSLILSIHPNLQYKYDETKGIIEKLLDFGKEAQNIFQKTSIYNEEIRTGDIIYDSNILNTKIISGLSYLPNIQTIKMNSKLKQDNSKIEINNILLYLLNRLICNYKLFPTNLHSLFQDSEPSINHIKFIVLLNCILRQLPENLIETIYLINTKIDKEGIQKLRTYDFGVHFEIHTEETSNSLFNKITNKFYYDTSKIKNQCIAFIKQFE
ncbi:MAG: hypothetical protein N4A49_09385 [Marinifilaceae bacterium]|jgi:mRNA-degrading endonuclease RelE of RelBE toxin-antitoxin system|nr:hypothetical protein [Marinifilaceae bacterium]